MGRAPNSGAPQRVSAHVVPKAPSTFASDQAEPDDEEEEKTTIESGWEEEASTTVEQGDVADRVRAIGATNAPPAPARNHTHITSTNGGALDEPTVDDQRANQALSLITPSLAPARIVVMAGNDKGQELEIRPGKTYTIGRAIDNDFVLTDIAVSRKHFDLRHENGTWVVADRGSGNGTVVNGTIEDLPFVLMNGDAIEIGNTTFRFDHANQPPRGRNTAFTIDVDEEEPSTVAGKPLRNNDELPQPPTTDKPLPRARTVPPPAPRMRAPSTAPPPFGMNGVRGSIPPMPSASPIGHPVNHAMPLGGPIGVPMASPTAPTVQPMAGMRPLGHPQMLDPNGMMRPQMLHNAHDGMQPLANVMPTTIPGQGPPVAPSQPQVMAFSYPNVGDMKPQLQQLHINGTMPRDATSTALVQPVPYGMHPGMPQQHPYAGALAQPQPGISKRVKVLLGGALLMVLAAIATIAIIKGSSSTEKPKPKAGETSAVEPAKETAAEAPEKTEPIVIAETPKNPDDPKKLEVQRKLDEQKKADEQKRLAEEQKKLEEQKKKAADDQKKLDEQKKKAADDQKKLEEQKQADEQKRIADEQRRVDDLKKLELKKAAQEQKKLDAEKRAEQLRLKRIEAEKRADEVRRKKAERKAAEDKRRESVAQTREPEEISTAPRKQPIDIPDIKEKAEQQYRSKKFSDAGKTLRSAAEKLGEAEATDLRSQAAVYEQVGRAYNVGTAPATAPVEAFLALERALNLDRPIGIFSDEIKTKLGAVASKAAAKYMSQQKYEDAFRAVRVAEANGGSNSTTASVREALTSTANELYTLAMEEKSSNPAAARAKLSRIRGMVDKGNVLVKAEKALRDIPKQ